MIYWKSCCRINVNIYKMSGPYSCRTVEYSLIQSLANWELILLVRLYVTSAVNSWYSCNIVHLVLKYNHSLTCWQHTVVNFVPFKPIQQLYVTANFNRNVSVSWYAITVYPKHEFWFLISKQPFFRRLRN